MVPSSENSCLIHWENGLIGWARKVESGKIRSGNFTWGKWTFFIFFIWPSEKTAYKVTTIACDIRVCKDIQSGAIITLSSITWYCIQHYSGDWVYCEELGKNDSDVIMGMMASQITSLTIVYSTIYSGVDQRKHQSSASLAFVWGIHRWLVNSPHKWPVMWKMFPFDDVIINWLCYKGITEYTVSPPFLAKVGKVGTNLKPAI